jgi:hypothetical protein
LAAITASSFNGGTTKKKLSTHFFILIAMLKFLGLASPQANEQGIKVVPTPLYRVRSFLLGEWERVMWSASRLNIQLYGRKDYAMKNNRIFTIARHKLLRRGLLAIFFLVCVALLSLSGSQVSSQTSTPTTPPQAQDETKPVDRLIKDAKSAGRDFTTVEPFNRQTRSVAADVARRRAVTAGSILQCDRMLSQTW